MGLTQEQLGALIDIPRNTIARWEWDELPIAKARQLELALSAILRPETDRSFRIRLDTFTDDPHQIINEHYDFDSGDDTNKVDQCPNWHRWKSTTWELRNSDNDKVMSQGIVRVTKTGIEVEVTSNSRKSA